MILFLNKKGPLDRCRDLDTLQGLPRKTLEKGLPNQKLTNTKKAGIRTIHDLSGGGPWNIKSRRRVRGLE